MILVGWRAIKPEIITTNCLLWRPDVMNVKVTDRIWSGKKKAILNYFEKSRHFS